MKRKKILIAVDSFKGCLSSIEIANYLEEGMLSSNPDLEITKIPLADGGEGTVEALVEGLGGVYVSAQVKDPLLRTINAKYGLINNRKTAIIEMAAASGLSLLKDTEKNLLLTSTYGTGELINHALMSGVKKIIVGIGGSATNDGGTGMASALGIKFLDQNNNMVGCNGGSLNKIFRIDTSNKCKELLNIPISVICDVTNTLYGTDGAAYVYGIQKGASQEELEILDTNLLHLTKIVEKDFSIYAHDIPGAGAAGGLGYGLMVFLNAKLTSGIDFLIDVLGLKEKIISADLVITGEGKIDRQTQFNKAPWGIVRLAKQLNKPIVGVAGNIEEYSGSSFKDKFEKLYTVRKLAKSFDDSMINAKNYLKMIGSEIAK